MMRKHLKIIYILGLVFAGGGFLFVLPEVVIAQEQGQVRLDEVKSIKQAQEELQQQILIKVQPKIIAMPGNKVPKVPIKYSRVRSDELRELMKQYNAVAIERVYESKKIGPEKTPTTYGALSSKDSKRGKFLKGKGKARKKFLKYAEKKGRIGENEEMVEVQDTFIVTFSDYIDAKGNTIHIDIDQVINDFTALSVMDSVEKR